MKLKVAIITSRFNSEITEQMHKSALDRLKEKNIPSENISTVWVPGSIEIPLIAQKFAREKKVDAIICLGAVIRGETTHYDSVCQQVSYGCQRVALDFNIPVIFGVITTENEEQAQARIHKGRESVDCAIDMVDVFNK